MKVAMIGCGNMGTAYVKSLIKKDVVQVENILLLEKSEERRTYLTQEKLGVVIGTLDDKIKEADIIVLATKPQYFSSVVTELKPFVQPNQILLSIMAGITIDFIQESCEHQKVVRAMPNTPCQLGKGVTGYAFDESITDTDLSKIQQVLESTGKAVQVQEEEKINAVTALAGSAPAYFMKFVKAMVETGEEMGVSKEDAFTFVLETMNGTYHLMKESDEEIQTLMDNVTSKGGTTAAALNHFDENNLEGIVNGALLKARNRGRELSKG